jgi:hypothetical protein
MSEAAKIKRTLSIGINVKDVRKLPKVGVDIAKFLKSVDIDHGPFDINIAVSVEPTEAGIIGPIEFPKAGDELPQTIEIVYVDSDDGADPEGVE